MQWHRIISTRVLVKSLQSTSIFLDLKADNYKALNEAYDPADYPDTYRNKYRELVGPYGNGLWAVGAYLSTSQAYATPGFFEAYANHCRENN